MRGKGRQRAFPGHPEAEAAAAAAAAAAAELTSFMEGVQVLEERTANQPQKTTETVKKLVLAAFRI